MPRTGFFSLPKLGRKNKTVSEESTGNSTPKASTSKSPAPSPPAKTGLRGRLSLEKPQEPPPPPPPVVVRTEKPRRGSVDEQHAVACPPAMKRPVWAITDYKFQECVHKGAASNVFKATCKMSGMSVAVKVYKKAALHPLNHFQIRREMKIHSRLQHPNIIDLYGCFEDEDFFVLVQEQATGGDLFDELRRRRRNLTERETLEIVLLPLLHALSYIHQRGIIHRDLKPENLLLTKNMILKICDFGLAIDCNVERPVTRLGTPQYMPPEIVVNPYKTYPEQHKDNPDCYYDEKVDVWAMAIMVYEVLYGFPTFGKNKDTLTGNILKKEPNFSPDLRSISAEAQEFLAINLSKKPSDRMSVREMFSHPWCRLHNRRSIGMQRTPAALQLGTSPAAAPQPTRRSLCGVESDQGEATPMDVDNAFTMTGFTGAPAAAAAAASSMPSKDARRGVRHSLDSRASGAAYVQRSGADVNPQVTKRVHVDILGAAPARIAPAAGTISPAAPFTMSAQQQQGASRSSPGMGQQQSLLGAGQVTAVSMFTPRRADALPAVAGASGGVHFPHITPSRECSGRVRRKSMEEESRAARGSPRALLFGEQALNGNGSGAKPSRHSVDSPAEQRQGVAPA